MNPNWRNTTQPLLHHRIPPQDQYNIYPTHPAGPITSGFAALAVQIRPHRTVLIDGYIGVFWDDFRERLSAALGMAATWIDMADLMLSETAIDDLVSPDLGGDDPLFGRRTALSLHDLFDPTQLADLQPGDNLTIVYGCGAGLMDWPDALLVYVDLPKNEIQYRSRAQTAWNLGQREAHPPKPTYKRYYFVDWVMLNRHKAALAPAIDWIVDGQWPDSPTMMSGDAFRTALAELSQTVFRVRPWFEPGAWGGQWMKQHIAGLPQAVPNYAWSFEMIAPEQGIILQDGETLLEVSFDFLMYHAAQAILGPYAANFGYEFPIRFDFLDTINGGNLSVQCHPRPAYIREQFGEHFTQDETYYILECADDSVVYLGFQDDIDPQVFREALESGTEIDIPRFVQQFESNKHDLFLIPNGTIHSSGKGNLVLEISATPYIFTFKMYDWMRLDLDGKPRPLNIQRAYDNLYFDRHDQLLSQPRVIEETEDCRIVHLPTHAAHFYDIHRLEITSSVSLSTDGSVQVLMVVEGDAIAIEVGANRWRYHYAETFIVPAAADTFRLLNEGSGEVKVVRAFMKADWFAQEENRWLSLP